MPQPAKLVDEGILGSEIGHAKTARVLEAVLYVPRMRGE
jgi:hypothetical protein